MPAIERVHQQRKDRVTIIGIDTSDPSRSDAKKLAARTGVTYDLAIDQDGQLAQALDFVVLPTTVFVDASGHVVMSHAGSTRQAHRPHRSRSRHDRRPLAFALTTGLLPREPVRLAMLPAYLSFFGKEAGAPLIGCHGRSRSW
jgi:hypothetical protein